MPTTSRICYEELTAADDREPFINHIPVEEQGDLMAAYYKRLTSEDESVVVAAAVPWRTWEDSTAKLIPDEKFTARAAEDTVAARAGARIEAHYFYHVVSTQLFATSGQ